MDTYGTVSQFTHYFIGKIFIHLSEHAVATRNLFFWAEDKDVISVLQSAGDYLNDKGDTEKTYDLFFNRAKQITELREFQTELIVKKDEYSVVARFLDPYWVFMMQYD
jgi:hypothetical protein